MPAADDEDRFGATFRGGHCVMPKHARERTKDERIVINDENSHIPPSPRGNATVESGDRTSLSSCLFCKRSSIANGAGSRVPCSSLRERANQSSGKIPASGSARTVGRAEG